MIFGTVSCLWAFDYAVVNRFYIALLPYLTVLFRAVLYVWCPPWALAPLAPGKGTGVALWAPSTCFFPTSLLPFVLYDDTLNDVIFPTLLCLGEEEDTNN